MDKSQDFIRKIKLTFLTTSKQKKLYNVSFQGGTELYSSFLMLF